MGLSIWSRSGLVGLLSLGLLVSSCGESEATTPVDLLEPALESAVDNAMVPAMQGFSLATVALEEEALGLCPEPSESKLRALQDDWLELAQAWNRAALYFLGPLDDDPITPTMFFIESMRQRGTDYNNTVRDTIVSAVEGAEPLDSAFFEGLSFNRVGLLALEVLLFEDGSPAPASNSPADIVASYESSERKCAYLEGMASLLADRARSVESGWTEDFAESGVAFRDLLLAGRLDDGSLPIPAVLLSAALYLEYIRDRKLEGILDAQIAAAARPEASPFFANVLSGLDELEAMMEPPGSEIGFYEVMEQRGFTDFANTVRVNLDAARTRLEDEDVTAAAEALLVLEGNLRNEVRQGLGVDLGIGFGDGD